MARTHCAGVFATTAIPKGTLVELSHCIEIPKSDYDSHLCHTVLEHYVFNGPGGGKLLALGVGSLFNHSSTPNLDYRVDPVNLIVRFFAARDIETDEELFIFYGKVWFKDTQPGAVRESPMHDHMEDENAFLSALEL
jgi:SET domain-containing protein